MKIIISPAKKMINSNDDFIPESIPVYLSETQTLLNEIRAYTKEELKNVLECNDQLLNLNYERFQNMSLDRNTSCALMSYVGLQYQHMGSHLFSLEEIDYLQKTLRILSGFYGILKPRDGIVPYRLEMQAKLNSTNLYDFWNRKLYDELTNEDHLILNLASKEYSQCIKSYQSDDVTIIDVDFVCEHKGKLTTKATEAKMCRGSMVRFCAVHQIKDIKELYSFNEYGYVYDAELSTETKLVFKKSNLNPASK